VYKDEFGKRPANQRPVLMALVITDGEADDGDAFGKALSGLHGAVFVTVAIIGYGRAHDECLQAYNKIAESNPHVRYAQHLVFLSTKIDLSNQTESLHLQLRLILKLSLMLF